MPEVSFHLLADRPAHAAACGRWEYQEWGRAGGKTAAEAAANFLAARRDALPLTLLACGGEDVLGMVSLWACDCPSRPDLTPWVASLYVAPRARGRGIGTGLFARIQHHARALGLRRLYLMTQHSEAVYAADGWHSFDRVEGPGAMRGAVLMRKDL